MRDYNYKPKPTKKFTIQDFILGTVFFGMTYAFMWYCIIIATS